MPAPGIVEHLYVVEDFATGRFPARVDIPLDALTLQELEKAIGHGIVMAVSSATHAALQIVRLEK